MGFIEGAAVEDGEGGFVFLGDGGGRAAEGFEDGGDGISKQRGGIDDGDGCGFGDLRVEVVQLGLHLLAGGFVAFKWFNTVQVGIAQALYAGDEAGTLLLKMLIGRGGLRGLHGAGERIGEGQVVLKLGEE